MAKRYFEIRFRINWDIIFFFGLGVDNSQYDTFAILRISYTTSNKPFIDNYNYYQFLLSPWYDSGGIDTIVNGSLYQNVIVLGSKYAYPRTTLLFSFSKGIISIGKGDSIILSKVN